MPKAARTNKIKKCFEQDRPSAYRRGYGSRWQRESKIFLRKHPLCVECAKKGIVRAATDVDHIEPHRGDYKKFWDKNNWQGLCTPCHNAKSAKEKRGKGVKKL